MIQRNIENRIIDALGDTPVIFLNGARQSGKSTLIQSIISNVYPAEYITFDEAGMLASAKSDPIGFLKSIVSPVALDEVQRVPELFLAIKANVDRTRKPGIFLLTGSANILLLPKIADALTGRMEIITLWPLSQGELNGRKEMFVDTLFSQTIPSSKLSSISRTEIIEKMLIGGFPEIQTRRTLQRRNSWFGSYVTTILQCDVRDLSRIEGLTTLPRLLAFLAARSSTLLNITELSNSAAIAQTSLRRYLTLLETTFLIKFLPAWSSNLGKRLIKTPKIVLCDTGLLAYLLGINTTTALEQSTFLGPLLENFVTMEFQKQITWSHLQPNLYHFRTLRGQEVDLLLEDRSGRIVGIEVKASSTVSESDFKNLRILSQICGKKFLRGVVLYTGAQVLPFGESMLAIPIQGLWELG